MSIHVACVGGGGNERNGAILIGGGKPLLARACPSVASGATTGWRSEALGCDGVDRLVVDMTALIAETSVLSRRVDPGLTRGDVSA